MTNEIVIDIASLSFTMGRIEEVALSKIFSKKPYKEVPDAFAVSWSEWVGGQNLEAEITEQTYKVKKFQRFEDYEEARKFFLGKVDNISKLYINGRIS